MKDLDEYTTAELEGELAKRREAAEKGMCDYCHRPLDTPPCRFPERHGGIPITLCGKDIRVDVRTLSYADVAKLAGQERPFAFNYPNGKEGWLTAGDYIIARAGLVIEVIA